MRKSFGAASFSVGSLDLVSEFQRLLFNTLEDEFYLIFLVDALGEGEGLDMMGQWGEKQYCCQLLNDSHGVGMIGNANFETSHFFSSSAGGPIHFLVRDPIARTVSAKKNTTYEENNDRIVERTVKHHIVAAILGMINQ